MWIKGWENGPKSRSQIIMAKSWNHPYNKDGKEQGYIEKRRRRDPQNYGEENKIPVKNQKRNHFPEEKNTSSRNHKRKWERRTWEIFSENKEEDHNLWPNKQEQNENRQTQEATETQPLCSREKDQAQKPGRGYQICGSEGEVEENPTSEYSFERRASRTRPRQATPSHEKLATAPSS